MAKTEQRTRTGTWRRERRRGLGGVDGVDDTQSEDAGTGRGRGPGHPQRAHERGETETERPREREIWSRGVRDAEPSSQRLGGRRRGRRQEDEDEDLAAQTAHPVRTVSVGGCRVCATERDARLNSEQQAGTRREKHAERGRPPLARGNAIRRLRAVSPPGKLQASRSLQRRYQGTGARCRSPDVQTSSQRMRRVGKGRRSRAVSSC